MPQELQQYASIIEQLKPMVKEPEFNQVLNQIAGHIPKEKRFLIKMEVKRLAKPCIRSIDLRGQVDQECGLYTYSDINHYLDDASIEVFEQQVRIFGQYCFGVYETVIASAKRQIAAEREAIAKNQGHLPDNNAVRTEKYQASVVNLLEYAQRQTERMNFAMSLEIFTEHNKSVVATSIDISTSGLKLKTLSDLPFKTGEKVSVYFRGLEAEYALDKRDAVMYQVIDTTREAKENHIRLKRAEEFPNPPFDQFLAKFIHGNKRRYKVNMSNTIDAIINKSCEQYFSPRYPSVPVFIDSVNGSLSPHYAMLNIVNRDILDYWTDEEDQLKLGYMLSEKRVKHLCSGNRLKQTEIYAFNHIQNEKIYFYSASQEELDAHPELKKVFLGFGSRKVSWRVFKVQALPASPLDAHAPLSIPDAIGKKIKLQNAPPPPRLMAKLKNLQYIVHITDVTSELGQQCYAMINVERYAIRQLKLFGHPRNRKPADIKAYRYKYYENRIETRYLLRTSVDVTFADVTLQGISEDISVHGLRIELNKPFHGSTDNRILLNFKKLQEITSKHNLTSLAYRVVHISSDYNVLHLRSIAGEEGKPARSFFDELIKQNRNKLKTYPDEEEYPGIGHALRCINARNTAVTSFVVQKKQGSYQPYVCVTPEQENRITSIASHMTKEKELDFEFLFRDRLSEEPFVNVGFKQARAEIRTINAELFCMFDPTQTAQRMVVVSKWSHRFASHKARKNFIEEALKRGQFIAIRTILTNTDKPDTDMLQLEMNYVSMYALHRAKALEENLWGIVGCAHLFDITDEVMVRYRYTKDIIEQNQKPPQSQQIEAEGIKALLQTK